MSLLLAFLGHELRVQRRSMRWRLVTVAYVASCLVFPVALRVAMLRPDAVTGIVTPGVFALGVHVFAPLATYLMSAVLAADGISRERDENALAVVALARMSSAGYVMRRFTALAVLALGVSLLPWLVAAALAASAGAMPLSASPYAWPWLLHVAPIAVAGTAMGLGLGTMTGSLLLALVIGGFGIGLTFNLANDLLALWGRHLAGPIDWLGFQAIKRLSFAEANLIGYPLGSDAPCDARLDGGVRLAQAGVLGAAAALCLALGILYLRRSQPEVHPWRISPRHPLRTYLAMANRARVWTVPDPRPGRADVGMVAACVAVAALLLGNQVLRAERFRRVLVAQDHAMRENPIASTPLSVVPIEWKVTGCLERAGSVVTHAAVSMRNEGAAPEPHLAFALGAGLEVRAATSSRGTVKLVRVEDRLGADLAPPLDPGEERTLSFDLGGVPVSYALVAAIEQVVGRHHSDEIPDLSGSMAVRAISPRRVDLDAEDLAPVPRYTTWQAVEPGAPGDPPIHVPDEEIFPFVTIDVDLAVPADMLVADSCGAVSAGQGARRLASRCASRLGRYVVKGGRLVEATEAEGGEGRIAGLPAHGARMAAWATTMAESARQGTEAWPGLRVPALFGMEWPQAYTSETITQPEWPQPAGFESHGRIVLIEEKAVVGRLRVQPISLVQASVAEELLQRRPIAVGDAELLAHLVEAVVASRLMSPGAVTAVIEMGRQPGEVAVSLMDPQAYAWKKWKSRLPAIVVALGAQLGEDRLATAINELLARTGEPATVRELFDILESDTGVSMSQTYDELIAGKAMPVLALVGVTFEGGRRGGDARTPYAVKGFVSNEGDGHSAVTLVLRTELDPVEISVSIGPHERSAFSMQARARPIVLLLDPRKTCFRWRPLNGAGMVEHVENPTHD